MEDPSFENRAAQNFQGPFFLYLPLVYALPTPLMVARHALPAVFQSFTVSSLLADTNYVQQTQVSAPVAHHTNDSTSTHQVAGWVKAHAVDGAFVAFVRFGGKFGPTCLSCLAL